MHCLLWKWLEVFFFFSVDILQRWQMSACRAGGDADGKDGAQRLLRAEGDAEGVWGRAGKGSARRFLKEKPRLCSDQSPLESGSNDIVRHLL